MDLNVLDAIYVDWYVQPMLSELQRELRSQRGENNDNIC